MRIPSLKELGQKNDQNKKVEEEIEIIFGFFYFIILFSIRPLLKAHTSPRRKFL